MPKINAHSVQAFCDYFGVGPWDVVVLERENISERDESPETKTYSTPIAIPA
ncbi:MAG: hypothetical protein HY862_02910 [Chloroflexi bacterium]|nr:hypothetical protein [Chloroflexota bacterium]